MRPYSFFRRRDPPRRDLLTVALEQTLGRGTCVLCHLLRRREYNGFWMLLWENVMDPLVRDALRGDLGFCPRHTLGLGHVAVVGRSGGTPAFAILLGDFVAEAAKRIAADKRPRLTPDCSECRRHNDAQAAYARRLAKHLRDDAWAASVDGLLTVCVPHHDMVLANVKDERGRRRLWRTLTAALTDAPLPATRAADLLFGLPPANSTPPTPRLGCPACARIRAAVDGREASSDGPAAVLCPTHLRAPMVGHGADAMRIAVGAREPSRYPAKAQPRIPLPRCPACDELARVSADDAVVTGATVNEASDRLFCVPHLSRILAVAPPADAQAVVAAQAPRLRALAAELDDFVRKSAWNHRDEPKGHEQTSWIRGTQCVAGETVTLS